MRHRLAQPAPGSGGRLRGVASAGNSLPATPPEVPSSGRSFARSRITWISPDTSKAAQTVEVRARVTGSLAKVVFKPGTMVKQGDLLSEIDPAPFQAEVDNREAEVRLAELRGRPATAELQDAKAPRRSPASGWKPNRRGGAGPEGGQRELESRPLDPRVHAVIRRSAAGSAAR